MGKGQIISSKGAGLYEVEIKYGGRDRVQAKISALNDRMDQLQDELTKEQEKDDPDPIQIQILELQIMALDKDVEYLTLNMPDDHIIDAWCVDLTEDLSGYVGTIEIPGEPQTVVIQPGFEDNADYSNSRDGQLFPSIACSPSQSFFNKAILPGWQRWKPTYRIAQIIPGSLDVGNGTCGLTILPAYSSQLNLSVNQGQGVAIGDLELGDLPEVVGPDAWEDFKSRYPSHPLVTNTEDPELLPLDLDLYKAIQNINAEVNNEHEYQTDKSGYNVGDYWDIMESGDKGDCDDFMLTKADRLINELGISPKYMQLALCFTEDGAYHAVLQVSTTGIPGSVGTGQLILDNRFSALMTRGLLATYYRWDRFLVNGDKWVIDARVSYNVPIEYMDCGASAFLDGDFVIVKFIDQDWSNPKVIGFLDNPRECGNYFYVTGNQSYALCGSESGYGFFRINILTGQPQWIKTDVNYNSQFGQGFCRISNSIIVVGGWTGDVYFSQNEKYVNEEMVYHDNVYLFTGGEKTVKESIPGEGRTDVSIFAIANKAYICGGRVYPYWWDHLYPMFQYPDQLKAFDDLFKFDLLTNSHETKQNLPAEKPNSFACILGESADYKGFVISGCGRHILNMDDPYLGWHCCNAEGEWYGFGGEWGEDIANADTCFRYDPDSDTWAIKISMPNPVADGLGFAIGQNAFYFDGFCFDEHPNSFKDYPVYPYDNYNWSVRVNVRYNRQTNSWQYMGNTPSDTWHIAMGASNDKGYLFGYTTELEVDGVAGLLEYDPDSDSWSIFARWEDFGLSPTDCDWPSVPPGERVHAII